MKNKDRVAYIGVLPAFTFLMLDITVERFIIFLIIIGGLICFIELNPFKPFFKS